MARIVQVIVRKAKLYSEPYEDSQVVANVDFMQILKIKEFCGNCFMRVATVPPSGREYKDGKTIVGYVHERSVTFKPITDLAELFFINTSGKQQKTYARIYGERKIGLLEPGEMLKCKAKCDGWILTAKGWVKEECMTKNRDIGNPETIQSLVDAVILRAVLDYKIVLKKAMKHPTKSGDEYYYILNRLFTLRNWFETGDFHKLFEERETGENRIVNIDRQLHVTEEWIEEERRKLDRMLAKKRIAVVKEEEDYDGFD